MSVTTLLRGGPHDGKIVETNGRVPTFLLGEPRAPSLLDAPEAVAEWNERAEWYELTTG